MRLYSVSLCSGIMPKTNLGHSNFRYVLLKKIISSEINAFEPDTLASLVVEHVGNLTGFLDDFNWRKDFWQFVRNKARVRSNSCSNW